MLHLKYAAHGVRFNQAFKFLIPFGKSGNYIFKSGNWVAKSANWIAKSGNRIAKSGNWIAKIGQPLF